MTLGLKYINKFNIIINFFNILSYIILKLLIEGKYET